MKMSSCNRDQALIKRKPSSKGENQTTAQSMGRAGEGKKQRVFLHCMGTRPWGAALSAGGAPVLLQALCKR